MMSSRRIRLQQVKDSPIRSAMKARMTMFKLSSTRTTADRTRKRPATTLTRDCSPRIPSSAEGQFLQLVIIDSLLVPTLIILL